MQIYGDGQREGGGKRERDRKRDRKRERKREGKREGKRERCSNEPVPATIRADATMRRTRLKSLTIFSS
jgi:hypothetical protein